MDRDGVTDDLTGVVGAAAGHAGFFDDVDGRVLIYRDGCIVGVGVCLVRICCGRVDNVGPRIDLGLCDKVRGGVVPSFTNIELAVSSCFTGGQCRCADEGVCHSHARQGLVAGVLDRDGVVDDIACCIGEATINGRVFDNVQTWLKHHVAKVHIHFFGINGCDHDGRRIGGSLYPASLLHFANGVGVVVGVCAVRVWDHRQGVLAIFTGQCELFVRIPNAILVLVNVDFPVGQADFVVGCAELVVDAIGIANAVAVHIAVFHAADFTHDDGRRCQLDRGGTATTNVHCRL